MSKEEIDRVLHGGEIFRDISWRRGQFSIHIPLGINEKMKREKILRSKQCCSQCCSRSSLSPKQCFSPKNTTWNGKKKNSTVLLLLLRILLFPFPLPFLGHFLFPSSIEHNLFPCKIFFRPLGCLKWKALRQFPHYHCEVKVKLAQIFKIDDSEKVNERSYFDWRASKILPFKNNAPQLNLNVKWCRCYKYPGKALLFLGGGCAPH